MVVLVLGASCLAYSHLASFEIFEGEEGFRPLTWQPMGRKDHHARRMEQPASPPSSPSVPPSGW